MTDETPTRLRTGSLSPRKPTRFAYRPDAAERAALARDLGLLALGALEFTGEIIPAGRDEMVLEGRIKAAADQACVATLVPVRSRVDEPVKRRFVAEADTPAGEEVEIPDDDTIEPMPEVIDLAAIAAEALMLALPLYPRAVGADARNVTHAAEGVAPLEDADLKPFAGLAKLAGTLAAKAGGDKDGSG